MGYICHYYFRDGEVQGTDNLGTYHVSNLAYIYMCVCVYIFWMHHYVEYAALKNGFGMPNKNRERQSILNTYFWDPLSSNSSICNGLDGLY